MRRFSVAVVLCFLVGIKSLCQSSLNDLDIIFKHNFENNTIGSYLTQEFAKDWLAPEWNSRQSTTRIVEEVNNTQNSSKALQLFYPANSLGPQEGGAQWWTYLKTGDEVYISYDLMFMPGFEFQQGGKLPSMMSGEVNAGNKPDGYDGFTTGLMFNKDGQVRFYLYYPDQSGVYGQSVIWGHSYADGFFDPVKITLEYTKGTDVKCIPGTWHNITYRAVLNSVGSNGGNHDGILEAYFDGKLVMQLSHILFRHTNALSLDCMRMYTFFGGSTDDFRNPIDEWLKVDNFILYTYKTGIDVPRGNKLSPTNRTINFWRNFENVTATNNAPVINAQQFTVKESTFSNNLIGTVVAKDADAGQTLTYSIASGNGSGIYSINSKTGVLSSTGSNIFVPGTVTHQLGIKVTDNGTSPKSATATITVNLVGDAPVVGTNNPPVINAQQFTVKESTFSNNLIGTVVAKDADAGQILTYSIASGNGSGIYSINDKTGVLSSTGSNIFVTGTVTHQLGIKVTDNGTSPKSASATITVNLVGDAPVVGTNNPPVISNQQFNISEADFSDNMIGSVIASDKDPGQHLSFAIVSGNESGLFSLNSQNGDLSTVKNNVFGPGTKSYELGVKVTDDGQEPASSTAIIKVSLIGSSKTVYIDPKNSNDLLENGSIDHPYDTWQDVAFKEGFTYLQKRGTSAQVEKLLISANNVSLGAYGEGEIPEITSETNTYLISGFEKSYIKIQNLRLQADQAVSVVYFLGSTCDSIIIDHCVLTGMANAVKMASGKTLISKYNIITSDHEGISSSALTNDIYYNIFKNCSTAVNVMSNQSKANVYNNVFVDNGESLSVSYAELTLYNNIFYMKSTGQKALKQGSGKISSDHNIFYPEQNGFITVSNENFDNLKQLQQGLNIDMNSFNSDPKFVDLYDDFTLEEGSPAINAGKELKLSKDFKGIKVPVAGSPDIGVYEFTGALFNNGGTSEEASVMTLYPNPSSGVVNVLAEIKMGKPEVDFTYDWSILKVLDISGKTILSKQIERTGSIVQDNIDLSGISNGLYFVVLHIADKIIKEKLIINR